LSRSPNTGRNVLSLKPTVTRRFIFDDRPFEAQNRERVGDLEVDFIVSAKQGTGYCLTAADRKIRVGNALEALAAVS
jgi:IS30 family transposase